MCLCTRELFLEYNQRIKDEIYGIINYGECNLFRRVCSKDQHHTRIIQIYKLVGCLDSLILHEYLRLNLRENLEQSLSSLVNWQIFNRNESTFIKIFWLIVKTDKDKKETKVYKIIVQILEILSFLSVKSIIS